MKRFALSVTVHVLLLLALLSCPGLSATTLTLWTPDNPAWLPQVLREFEAKHPGVVVEHVAQGWNALREKTVVAIVGGSPPDLFATGIGGVTYFAAQGMVMPLDSYLTAGRWSRDIFPGFFTSATWEGATYGVPWRGEPATLGYSARIFAESALDPEKPPVTWSELQKYGQRLAVVDSAGAFQRNGFEPRFRDSQEHEFVTLFKQFGGDNFTPDGKRVGFDNDAGLQAMQVMADWFLYGATSTSAPTGVNARINGRVAMAWEVNALKSLSQMKKAIANGDEDWQVALLPKDKRQVYFAGGTVLLIPKGSKNPDLAMELIAFLIDQSGARAAFSAGEIVPRRSLPRWVTMNKKELAYLSAFEFSESNPPHPVWPDLINPIRRFTADAMRQNLSPKEALVSLVTECNAIIAAQLAK